MASRHMIFQACTIRAIYYYKRHGLLLTKALILDRHSIPILPTDTAAQFHVYVIPIGVNCPRKHCAAVLTNQSNVLIYSKGPVLTVRS